MHRSGTSVLTHLLATMGCHVGPPESLQAADAANPQGYWESRAAWALDEDVLAALGASWWAVADLDLAAIEPADRERFAARAREVVDELDARRPWVLKEPRLSVLLPLWRPALSAPAFAFVHRDPLEVARSLQSRDAFPVAVGLALWEIYTLAALRHSLGAPRTAVSYRRLLADPARVAAELVEQLSPLAPGALRVPSTEELAAVVRPELHRERAAANEAAGYLSAAQQRLAAAVDDGSALAWSEVPAPSAGSLELLRWFAVDERERRGLPGLRHRIDSAEAEAAWRRDRDADLVRWNDTLRAALAAAEPEIERLQQLVAEVSRHNEELDGAVARLQSENATQRRFVEELDREPARLRVALRRSEAALVEAHGHFAALHQLLGDTIGYAERCWQLSVALDRLVEDLLASRSWRTGQALALPLRWRRRRGPTAQLRHDDVRADAEALAAQRRDVARRADHWSGGLPPPATAPPATAEPADRPPGPPASKETGPHRD